MKKLSVCVLVLCFSGILHAQSGNERDQQDITPTPANVLSWSAELLPKLEQLIPKIEKIKPVQQPDIETKEIILEAKKRLLDIRRAGTTLTAAEAKAQDAWFRKSIKNLQGNCPNGPDGSECCFSCNGSSSSGGHGWNVMWCFANCFVFRFPGLD